MFDEISTDWAKKRAYPWKSFLEIAIPIITIRIQNHTLPEFPLVVDLGAGSGRHSHIWLEYFARLVDVDESRPMLRLNSSSSLKIQAKLPFCPIRDSQFDAVFSIATLHHISTVEFRKQMISEIIRIGIEKGLVLLTVWRFFQQRFKQEFKTQLTSDCTDHLLSSITRKKEIGDITIPWKIESGITSRVIPRFYHLFRISEFHQLVHPLYLLKFTCFGNEIPKPNFFFAGLIRKRNNFA